MLESAGPTAPATDGTPADAGSRAHRVERVLSVRHWTPHYFSLTTTRDTGFRFDNGQFVMLGLATAKGPLMRAYSIASPNWDDTLEFFSIKVPDGRLTSKLQHVQPGDELLLSRKPTGTLLASDLHPGRVLYLLGSGTGLAPFLSIIRDPETYARFETVVLAHGVRGVADLAYRDLIEHELPNHEYLGDLVRAGLRYYPAVTREPFHHQGRLTDLLASGQMSRDLGLPPVDATRDRAMICGSTAMLNDTRSLLDGLGMKPSPRIGVASEYVFERAFV